MTLPARPFFAAPTAWSQSIPQVPGVGWVYPEGGSFNVIGVLDVDLAREHVTERHKAGESIDELGSFHFYSLEHHLALHWCTRESKRL